jgi:predicted Zn-dependent protease
MRGLRPDHRRSGAGLLAPLRLAIAILLSLLLASQPAAAQSILRDAETEAYFNDISKPLIVAAGLDPNNVKVMLIGDMEINAFVAGGQIVYINAGLIKAADNTNQLQGVIAHELGHVAGGHAINTAGGKEATGITILSLLLAGAAAAAGGGEAAMGVLSAGQTAAMGKFLAFNRTQEASADAAAMSYLLKAKISGKGSLDFFKKLEQEEYRLSSSYVDTDPFAQTHPMSADRIANLEQGYKASPWWATKTDPALDARFKRVRAKLIGYVEEPEQTLKIYPESDRSVAGMYARAYAWHRAAYPDKAQEEVAKLVATAPHDPYFLELKGQILLESGKPHEAIPVLREAVQRAPNQPLIASLFGHALIATEDAKNFAEAKGVLKAALARDDENPFAWYQLGVVYDREGDQARAALATAERYNLEGNAQLALVNARLALAGIPSGTPDWIRAQDIAMVSENAVAKKKRKS